MKNEKTQTEILNELAQRAQGLKYESPEARAILDDGDWAQWWPTCDRNGILDGGIIDSQPDFANVDDLAMVQFSELTPSEIADVRESGYFNAE